MSRIYKLSAAALSTTHHVFINQDFLGTYIQVPRYLLQGLHIGYLLILHMLLH